MTKEMTCIICPRGCALKAETENGSFLGVTGNACSRGEQYAYHECINPVRTVTSTMKSAEGKTVPVKTSVPIPKGRMFECMELINQAKVDLPVRIGDVILADVCGSNIVACANVD